MLPGSDGRAPGWIIAAACGRALAVGGSALSSLDVSLSREPADPGGRRAGRPGPGGPRRGTGEFLVGLALMIVGGYLFLDSVMVTSHWGSVFQGGQGSFGLSLLPLLIGIAVLFFNGKSVIGWVLAAGGLAVIFVGVISRLSIHFKSRTLFETLLILGLVMAGIGLIAKSLRSHNSR
jgi:uncharacterized protein